MTSKVDKFGSLRYTSHGRLGNTLRITRESNNRPVVVGIHRLPEHGNARSSGNCLFNGIDFGCVTTFGEVWNALYYSASQATAPSL